MTEDKKCRICRRAGEKLFLKGEKCFTPKCVFNKKPYAPGKIDTQKKHRGQVTEYGRQLREKQKVRNIYGLREKQFANYVKSATIRNTSMTPTEALYESLETRLDNVVFRTGLALSRSLARQMVSHGHITVNGKKVTIPSYRVKRADIVGVREGSRASKLFADITPRLKKHPVPAWLKFNPDLLEGEISGTPKTDKEEAAFNLASVIEFYSR